MDNLENDVENTKTLTFCDRDSEPRKITLSSILYLLLPTTRTFRAIDDKSYLLHLVTKERFHPYFLQISSFYLYQVDEYI